MNPYWSILFTNGGITILLNALHFWKAAYSIIFKLGGKTTSANFEHSAKAQALIFSTDLGILIFTNSLQEWNAYSSISTNWELITTSLSELQESKAFFPIVFTFSGITIFSNEISKVEVDGPAYKAGILAGDKIIKIGDKNIENFEDIKTELLLNVKENLNLTIDRKGEVFEKTVIPEIKYDKKTKNPYLGIISNEAIHKKVGFFTAGGESLKQIWKISITTLKALGQMITAKRGFDDVGGPIKIAQYSGKAMKAGFSTMIYFIALISVSLGFMNLLPIPVLDGGHLLFYIIEAITKKPVNEKVENFLSKVFYGLLILLMLLITIKDIKGIF